MWAFCSAPVESEHGRLSTVTGTAPHKAPQPLRQHANVNSVLGCSCFNHNHMPCTPTPPGPGPQSALHSASHTTALCYRACWFVRLITALCLLNIIFQPRLYHTWGGRSLAVVKAGLWSGCHSCMGGCRKNRWTMYVTAGVPFKETITLQLQQKSLRSHSLYKFYFNVNY